MGASLDTPVRCPLCKELTGDPITLKCNHRFCQRCIEDLWSITPAGPYHCPVFKCETVFKNLPFDRRKQSPAGRWTLPRRSAAGSPNSDEQSTVDSLLRRPSLTRLLGKRKAEAPAAEQPDAKRSSTETPRGLPDDTETPCTSQTGLPQQPTPEETPQDEVHTEPQFEYGDHSDSTENTDGSVAPAGSGESTEEISDLQIEHSIISLEDSESSSEVDICYSLLPETPKTDAQVMGACASPKESASPANCDESARATNPLKGDSPIHVFPKTPPSSSGSRSLSGGPVPCHYCPKMECQVAVKTCLVCGASMCKEHLRPHLDSPVFQNHTLVSPVEDISVWRCQDHQEINRIYCRQCSVCVCTVCTVIGSHRDHACISIREAERELRGSLNDQIKQLRDTEQRVKSTVAELTQKKETFRELLNGALVGVKQQYGAIREALNQEEQSAVECVTKEEKRVLGGLEEKLCLLQSSLESIQTSLHTLGDLAGAKGDGRIQDQAFIVEYSKISQMTSCLENGVEQLETPEDVDRARLRCLQTWTEKRLDGVVLAMPGNDRDLYRLLYGITPHLDANTAHPKLQLSDDNRRATYTESQQTYVEHEARFSSFPQVLATSALEGGRWYWEVSVSADDGRWKVGLCEGQIERKGQRDSSRLGFNSFSWCLAYDRKKVEALHNKVSVPLNAVGLHRVGVFLNFEEGIVSFFSVAPGGSLALMHSYKQRFTGPLYPALSVSKTQLAVCDLFQS